MGAGQALPEAGIRKNQGIQSIISVMPAAPLAPEDLTMNVSFKDYISTFARVEEFTSKPYAKFYTEAIDKHREQLVSQISHQTK
jgi:hypothetical protein